MGFKDEYTLENRKSESNKIIFKYPTRIPVIVEKSAGCELPDISKKKYLVPKDMSMSQFIYVVRKRIELESSKSLFIMINDHLVPSAKSLGVIYEDDSDEDGFLYMIYTTENTFG